MASSEDGGTSRGVGHGASYSWSQTHSDIDVQIILPQPGIASKDIDVSISSDTVLVMLAGHQQPLMEGKLSWPVKREGSCWTRVPGMHIHLSLEKATPRWWSSLLQGEPALDPAAQDRSKPIEELSGEEQMKVQELLWRHHQKLSRAAGVPE